MKLERSEWRHPGGKLRDKGAESLTDAGLLAILISAGYHGHVSGRDC